MKKHTLSIMLLLVIFTASSTLPAFAAEAEYLPDTSGYSYSFQKRHEFPKDYTELADALSELGLFRGTGNGYELSRNISRIEALVTVVRLLNAEETALTEKNTSTFTDVPDWAADYAGYGQTYGIMTGYSGSTMGAEDNVTAKQYLTMLLRVLGFSDSAGDFTYDAAIEYAYGAGIIDNWAYSYFEKDPVLTRNEVIYLMYQSLYADTNTGEDPIILQLTASDDELLQKVAASLVERGESADEIKRALLNGYHEYHLTELCGLVDANSQIPARFKDSVKECFYSWLKEAGTDAYTVGIKYCISNLKMTVRSSSSDSVFSENGNVLGYFQYPDLIVMRHDLDPATEAATLAHELRHAMSSNLGITILEEGVTETWAQEVNDGNYSYPYYYVNIAKVLTHLVGAETMNKVDLSGSYEDLFYELQRRIGGDFDRDGLYAKLVSFNSGTGTASSLAALNAQFLELVEAYYDHNLDSIIEESENSDHFIDTVIALGQLLYYPSSMILRAESDAAALAPSEYYSADFSRWADEILSAYCARTGDDLTKLRQYFSQNKDKRYSYEYFGPGAGTIFVNEGTAYVVYYQYDSWFYSKSFGEKVKAEEFQKSVRVKNVEEKAGNGFVAKQYN